MTASRRRAAGEWLEALARGPSRRRGAHRWRGALDRRRGRRAVPGRRRGVATRRSAGAPSWPRRTTRLATLWRAGRGATGPFLTEAPAARWGLPVGVVERTLEDLMAGRPPRARRVPARRRGARMVRPGGPAAAPAPLAGPAAPRDRAGGADGAGALPARLAGRRERRGGPRSAGRGHRPARGRAPSRRACSSATSCRLACAATRPRCSTSSERRARSSGWGRAVSGATTAGSRSTGPTAWLCCWPPGSLAQAPRSTTGQRATVDGTEDWLRDALRSRLAARGASFYRDLMAAALEAAAARRAPAARPSGSCSMPSGTSSGPARSATTRSRRCAPCAGRDAAATRRASPARPRPGARLGPPEAAGRWSLVADTVRSTALLAGGTEPSADRAATAAGARRCSSATAWSRATPSWPRASVGGFGAVYPVLREMEERGRVRRGYFVEGLGGAQFAVAGRGRPAARPGSRIPAAAPADSGPTVSSWPPPTLPTPYGAALAWPRDEDRHGADAQPRGGRLRRARTTATWLCTSSAAAARCSPSRGSMMTRSPLPRSRRSARPAHGRPAPPTPGRTHRRAPHRVIAPPAAPRDAGLPAGISRPRPGPEPAGGRGRARAFGPVPEGDTLRRTADVLERALAGGEVVAASARPGGAQLARVVGSRIEAVRSRGKHLLIDLDCGLTLHTHLGMTARGTATGRASARRRRRGAVPPWPGVPA